MANSAPFIVAVGGTTRPGSSTEKALRRVLAFAEAKAARVQLFSGDAIDLPMFRPEVAERDSRTSDIIEAIRTADGIVLGSPGYHGGVSGLVKNVLDYIEDLRGDTRCYLDGRAVGCVGTGAGWQGAGASLNALRTIVHALRGWNTPMGIVVNTIQPCFDAEGKGLERLEDQFELMADQILGFALRERAFKAA